MQHHRLRGIREIRPQHHTAPERQIRERAAAFADEGDACAVVSSGAVKIHGAARSHGQRDAVFQRAGKGAILTQHAVVAGLDARPRRAREVLQRHRPRVVLEIRPQCHAASERQFFERAAAFADEGGACAVVSAGAGKVHGVARSHGQGDAVFECAGKGAALAHAVVAGLYAGRR